PLDAVERIEIIRGAGSVLYGDNAVGGVVNIITKEGKGDLSGKLGAFYGSYDTQGTDAELSGSHKGLSYYFYSKYFDECGYREHSDVASKDFNTRLGYKLSDKLKISFNTGRHQDEAELPGGLDETELQTLGRRGSANQDDMADTTDKYYQLSFDATPWPEDMYYGNFLVDLHYRDRHVFDSFWGTFNTDRDIRTKGITAKYIFNKPVFDKSVNFVTGIDYYDAENKILGSGTNSDDIDISKTEWGMYGFLQYELFDRFFVNGGTRFHKADYTFNDKMAVSFIEKDPSEWVSMGGLKYEYGKGSNIHANVQETFRFLTTDEWYTWSGLNTDLKQQTGRQYEIGVKHNFDDVLLAHLTPYWIDNKNEIFYDPTAGGGWGANSNYEKTRRVGFETGTDFNLLKFFDMNSLDKLNFFVNYTYQKAEFKEGVNDGKEIPMVP
ncbi:MAG TPA: TonB-dependent receptor, partial [Candidatus Omnitrophota bacterium]|nr:TonB-dependent receptor [Candidatus Omnitrophota bacterium]